MCSGDPRWVLAVDHGTTVTVGAVADVDPADGWVRVSAVPESGAAGLPSAVLSRTDGTVLTGHAALSAGFDDPAAAVLRAREYLATATGGPDDVALTTWPRPTTAVNAATALVATLLRAEFGRRGRPPEAVVLTHPASWSQSACGALAAAGRAVLAPMAGSDAGRVRLLPTPVATAIRLGGTGPLAVVDVGGGGTEVTLLDRTDAGPAVRSTRAVAVGAEGLDDVLAQLVLDRARPELASRIRFGGDLEAHRAWFALRQRVREGKEQLGGAGTLEVVLPVVAPESPGRATVTLTHADLGENFAPGLEEIGRAVAEVVGGERPELLVRGGVTALPGVRDWLARRAGLTPTTVADPGAASGLGPASGAAAWAAERLGLGLGLGQGRD